MIKQGHISRGIRFFEQTFRTKYGLEPISDTSAPAVIIGMYEEKDFDILLNFVQKGTFVVVVFVGSDALHLDNPLRFRFGTDVFKAENVHLVGTSNFIREDLQKAGLEFKICPVSPANGSLFYRGVVYNDNRGACIYFYCPPDREAQYGWDFLAQNGFVMLSDAIEFKMTDKVYHFPLIRSWPGRFPRGDMRRIYNSCFLGLRLTEHDGLSTTVAEMGLCGIPSIYNGGLPGSIAWDKEKAEQLKTDIVLAWEGVGIRGDEIAENMKRFLFANDLDFLKEEFYQQ